ncbi:MULTISPECIES: hypothetical protein [Peptostreptococcaceae]|uniref:hypothetical protein n=1 Tax=Peptostreptococcaceae TaxID=186804 RepID=UPI00082167A1|nr:MULTISPECIES: hypothetical protein [Peptostreptococcaceae]SCI50167.1 Uncharacterised protein [uncultured Clostridium sp.]MCE4921885.1 hypothetical protein [Clostridioides difficile]MCH1964625.1 hypothetical protein [Paeniclostridium sordellii]MDM0309427.1 hypothetical protein [Clostridioides difficile]MDM0378955.1 hypothetical protein [Clostridioides difficile]
MARKKEYITTLYKRDDDTLKAVARTGYYTDDMIKDNFNQTDRRITNMCRDGYLVKEDTMRGTFYKIGDKGKDYVEKEFGIKCYPAQSPNHDMEISRRYCSLDESTRETWRTELEVREDLYKHINDLKDKGEFSRADEIERGLKDGTMSVPDCSYKVVTEEQVVREIYFEVVTDNYSKADIQAKENVAVATNTTIEYSKV